MISSAFKWRAKPERRGRIWMDRRIARMAKAQPMISSKMIRDSLKLPVTVRRRLCEANLLARSPRKVPHVLKGIQFAKEHIHWPKEKWRNILWTDESKIVLFGSKGRRQTTPKLWIQATVHSEDSEAWWWKHHVMDMFLLLWCWAYLPHTRDHGPVCIHQYTWTCHEEDLPLKWIFQPDSDTLVNEQNLGSSPTKLRLWSGQPNPR